jgi:uncharacterized protein (TIGR02246 family)
MPRLQLPSRYTQQRLFICVVSALVLTVCAAPVSRAAETTAAEDAVRRSAQVFTEAFDKGNAEAVAAQWTTDGEYTIGSQSLKGREQIANAYREFFRTHPGAKMTVKIESIRVVAPTVAIEQGTASTTGGERGGRSEAAYTAVHVKQGEKWLMANVRESEMPSTSAPADLNDVAWLVGTWAANGDASKVQMSYEWMANKHFLKGQTTVTTKEGSSSGGTQIIGKDPQSGRLVSWFFNADGGHGVGEWSREGQRWIINTEGTSAEGAPTSATNVLYHADDNVASWQSVNRAIGDMQLPNTKEVVMERVSTN